MKERFLLKYDTFPHKYQLMYIWYPVVVQWYIRGAHKSINAPLYVKKAEHWRIDASKLSCWRRLLRVHSEGDQPWDFFGRNDAKAETPVLWPPHAKSWLIGKDSVAGRDWGQEDKGTTEDEMAGWHHWLDGCESAWTPGVGDGQGDLACCDSWGRKELDTTEQLNWTDWYKQIFSVDVNKIWFYPFCTENQETQGISCPVLLLFSFLFLLDHILRNRSSWNMCSTSIFFW